MSSIHVENNPECGCLFCTTYREFLAEAIQQNLAFGPLVEDPNNNTVVIPEVLHQIRQQIDGAPNHEPAAQDDDDDFVLPVLELLPEEVPQEVARIPPPPPRDQVMARVRYENERNLSAQNFANDLEDLLSLAGQEEPDVEDNQESFDFEDDSDSEYYAQPDY